MIMACRNCRYRQNDAPTSEGIHECRRYPPRTTEARCEPPIGFQVLVAPWPRVEMTWWCGEWARDTTEI